MLVRAYAQEDVLPQLPLRRLRRLQRVAVALWRHGGRPPFQRRE